MPTTANASHAGENERNVVAEQKNWEQRVNTELEASKLWAENWGELYEHAKSMADQVKDLEQKLQELPGEKLATNTQLTYTWPRPFQEFDLRKKKTLKFVT